MNENKLHSTNFKAESNSAVMNPKCSCPECDSLDCFLTRNTKVSCPCVKCTSSEICLNCSNKVNANEKKSELNIVWKTKTLVNLKKKINSEYTGNGVIYDFNRNTKLSSATNKQSKYSYTTSGCKSNFQFESEKDERSHLKVHSVSMKFSRINFNTATTDLSAQVMNVPYNDLKNCLSINKSGNSYNQKMSKHNILERFKEAYKACSCKVCECITGKSDTKNEVCKCKPCNCNDCTSFLSKVNFVNESVHLPMDSCPCIRCTRAQCKGIVNKSNEPQICDCKPCDYIKCIDSINKLCKCQPCQCVECNTMSTHLPTTLFVAPAEDDYQGNMCQCSPCDCIQCGHGRGHRTPSNLHELLTGNNIRSLCYCEVCVSNACDRDDNNSSKYQRYNKIFMKPIQKDAHDYDIKTILTNKDTRRLKDIKLMCKNDNDNIAMFATLPEQYRTEWDSLKNRSNCDNCNCLVNNCNENAANSIQFSHIKPTTSFCLKSCCEYVLLESHISSDNTVNNRNSYRFNTCDYFNCESLAKIPLSKKSSSVKLINKVSYKTICNKSGLCVLCSKLIHTAQDALDMQCKKEVCLSYSSDDIYPIKKAKLLTPSILNGIECQNMYSNNECYLMNLGELLKVSEVTLKKEVSNIQSSSHRDQSNKQSSDTFNINMTDRSYNNNNTNSNESSVNNIKHVPLYTDESVHAHITNKAYNQDIVNKLILSEAIDNSLKNLSSDIILSGPQLNINRDQYEKPKYKFNNHFKHKTLSVTEDRHLENAYIKNKTMNLPKLSVNYERVKKTLHEAKVYSSYLMKVLDEYEHANAEFQSISQKLKSSYDPLVGNRYTFTSIPLTETNVNNNNQIVATNETDYGIKKQCEHIIKNPKHFKLGLKNEDDLRLPTKNVVNQDIPLQKTVKVDFNRDLKLQNVHVTPNNIGLNSYNDSATSTCFSNYVHTKPHLKTRRRVTCYKSNYYKLLRRAIILSKKNNLLRKAKTTIKGGIQSETAKYVSAPNLYILKNGTDEEDNQSLNKLIIGNIERIKDNTSNNINIINRASTERCVSTSYVKIEERGKMENDLDVIDFSKQNKDQRAKGSCDALKVSFLGLRRVSDHAVFVKWNIPCNTTDIQGYELQVDGRAVQKILSPTRNVAVVTCLPHSDKILLTIRTITSAITGSDHYPSVTVIYHPREK